MGCNSSAEHADNEGYVLPSGVVCFTSSSLIYQTDSKNRPFVLSMEFSFLFLFLSFFFCLNFLPLHSKIYIIFFKDLDGNFIYIHSYILASNFFSSFVRTFI